MDKASASGAGDSRFESWAGHCVACARSIDDACARSSDLAYPLMHPMTHPMVATNVFQETTLLLRPRIHLSAKLFLSMNSAPPLTSIVQPTSKTPLHQTCALKHIFLFACASWCSHLLGVWEWQNCVAQMENMRFKKINKNIFFFRVERAMKYASEKK